MRRLIDVATVLAGGLLALVVYAHAAPLPDPYDRIDAGGTVVLASDGTILWRDTAAGVHIPVNLEHISPAAIEATIAAEDQRFREHPGVDPLAVTRAVVRMPLTLSGASTITQQLARQLYLGGEDNLLLRKVREAQIATQLEAHYSKDEILELYLNQVYYGRGAYGIEAAARVYFGVGAANLDLARAAFLAGLVQSPSIGEAAGEASFERQGYVLDRMVSSRVITDVDRAAAFAVPLGILPATAPPLAPHFVGMALEEAERLVPGISERDGVVIETTLDTSLQATSEAQALLQLDRLEANDANNAAVVVLDPRNGRILALAGNVTRKEAGSAFNMADEPRQPGSALKPFLYSLALEDGYTAASPLLDIPSSFGTGDAAYAPQNYDRQFRGVVTLRTALGSSLNVPAVAMLDEVGPARFSERLRDFGITSVLDPGRHDLALALGSGEVSLLELTAAYGALAAGGRLQPPFAVTRIRDASGAVLYERQATTGGPVVSAEIAFLLADILTDDGARVSGFGTGSILSLPFPAAVKTGTTTDFHDNWTLGFTPRQAVGVWVGNVDNRAMRQVSGIDGAAPIWAEVMKAARDIQGDERFLAPARLVRVPTCTPTGLLPGAACPSTSEEWFVPGTVPTEVETYFVRNESGTLALNPPAAARPWLAAGGYRLADEADAKAVVVIAQPANGSVFYIAPELTRQELALRIACPGDAEASEILVDGVLVEEMDGCAVQVVIALEAGTHTITARVRISGGERIESTTTYEVRRP